MEGGRVVEEWTGMITPQMQCCVKRWTGLRSWYSWPDHLWNPPPLMPDAPESAFCLESHLLSGTSPRPCPCSLSHGAWRPLWIPRTLAVGITCSNISSELLGEPGSGDLVLLLESCVKLTLCFPVWRWKGLEPHLEADVSVQFDCFFQSKLLARVCFCFLSIFYVSVTT